MELDSIDRKLVLLEAYIIPFQGNIAEAKEKFPEEISFKIKKLEELLIITESPRYRALDAIKKNDFKTYSQCMWEIKCKYDLKKVSRLQSGTVMGIKKHLEKRDTGEIKKEERPTEEIQKPCKADTATEGTALQIQKEKYQELIKKYKNQMYEIRQSIDAYLEKKGDRPAEDKIQAFLANLIEDITTIQKRTDTEKLVKEEKKALKKYIKKTIKNNYSGKLVLAYEKELRKIGIEPKANP